jgi:hypothetical protein
MIASRQRLINYSLNCKNNKEIPSFDDLYIFEWKIPKNLKFIEGFECTKFHLSTKSASWVKKGNLGCKIKVKSACYKRI